MTLEAIEPHIQAIVESKTSEAFASARFLPALP